MSMTVYALIYEGGFVSVYFSGQYPEPITASIKVDSYNTVFIVQTSMQRRLSSTFTNFPLISSLPQTHSDPGPQNPASAYSWLQILAAAEQ